MASEEELVVCVHNYEVLYDYKDFHRKDIKRNAWKAVSEELGLEDGKLIFINQ